MNPEGFEVDHLGIAVRSIDEALRFYRDQLGMRVSLRERVEREQVEVAMLSAGASRLELLEPAEPHSVVGRFLEKRGPGLHHIALRVRRFAEIIERLKAAGAKIVDEPRRGAGGQLYVFVHPASTGGILLELIEEEHEN